MAIAVDASQTTTVSINTTNHRRYRMSLYIMLTIALREGNYERAAEIIEEIECGGMDSDIESFYDNEGL